MLNLETILQKHREYEREADLDLIRRAYAFADVAHLGQKRLNGEEELTHLLQTTDYLADYRADHPPEDQLDLADGRTDTLGDVANLEAR
ncbi:MAG: GTP pyrophosphokinase, partial [Patescibacteria group bacterium]